MDSTTSELALLERVRDAAGEEGRLTQRELARSSGLSLGMTNAVIKRLAERGLLSLSRISARSFRYILTPDGAAELARRTVGYIRASSRSVELYAERIETFVLQAKRGGVDTVVLVGSSEADFVLERVCERHGLAFMKSADPERARVLSRREGVRLVWGERSAMAAAMPAAAAGEMELASIGASRGAASPAAPLP